MARSRQIVLVRLAAGDPDETANPTIADAVPLGTYREVVRAIGDFNISVDGSPDSIGMLYGPGMTVQMPLVGPDENVSQVLVSLDEEEIAWAVLARLCPTLGWKMMDPGSGRMFG